MGLLLSKMGKPVHAVEALTEAQELWQQLVDAGPEVRQYKASFDQVYREKLRILDAAMPSRPFAP